MALLSELYLERLQRQRAGGALGVPAVPNTGQQTLANRQVLPAAQLPNSYQPAQQSPLAKGGVAKTNQLIDSWNRANTSDTAQLSKIPTADDMMTKMLRMAGESMGFTDVAGNQAAAAKSMEAMAAGGPSNVPSAALGATTPVMQPAVGPGAVPAAGGSPATGAAGEGIMSGLGSALSGAGEAVAGAASGAASAVGSGVSALGSGLSSLLGLIFAY